MGRLASLFSRASELLYPAKCVSCGDLLDQPQDVFCRSCYDSYENAKQDVCSRCFRPRCRCTCPSFSLGKAGLRRLVKLYKYHPSEGDLPENRILFALKQKHLASVVSFLGRDLSEAIGEALTPNEKASAVVVPCPRSDQAKRKNGYDHMAELCREVSKQTGFAYSGALQRRPGGKMQKGLSGTERKKNTENRFFVKRADEIAGKTVLLIDDVTTSGATLTECRRAVLTAGASRVVLCVLAVSGRDFVVRPRKTRGKQRRYKKERAQSPKTEKAPRQSERNPNQS